MTGRDIIGIVLIAGPVITLNLILLALNVGGSRILRLPRR